MSWSLKFDPPIRLARNKPLCTLRHAADHILSLPIREAEQKRWQTALGCLISAAESGGSVRTARNAVVQALDAEKTRSGTSDQGKNKRPVRSNANRT